MEPEAIAGDELEPGAVASDPVLAERHVVLRRSLRGLPSEVLAAMVAGLEKHRGELVTGRLFRSHAGGGCAVGITLRELEPGRYEGGRLRFWLRHRWRLRASSYGEGVAASPRLRHLEWTFDAAAERLRELRPGVSRAGAAAAVGAWFRSEAESELRWRRLVEAAGAPVEYAAGAAR